MLFHENISKPPVLRCAHSSLIHRILPKIGTVNIKTSRNFDPKFTAIAKGPLEILPDISGGALTLVEVFRRETLPLASSSLMLGPII